MGSQHLCIFVLIAGYVLCRALIIERNTRLFENGSEDIETMFLIDSHTSTIDHLYYIIGIVSMLIAKCHAERGCAAELY